MAKFQTWVSSELFKVDIEAALAVSWRLGDSKMGGVAFYLQ
jgi:hypothetical protein